MKNFLIILLSVLLVACNSKKTETAGAAASNPDSAEVFLSDAQIKNAGITTGKPELKPLNSTLLLNGDVEVPPENLVSVSFPMGGFLRSTRLSPGMKVSKGQVIALMEDQAYIDLQQNYLLAKNKLYFLQKEFKRQQQLNTAKTTSDKAFEQVASDYQSQRIQLNALAQKLMLIGIPPSQLSETNIRRQVNLYSPISGFVSAVHANVGKYINPSEVLFDLVNPRDLQLSLTVFERDLNALKPGQRVLAYLPGDTTQTYEANVVLINKSVDNNRSAVVRCHFLLKQPSLHPGMYLNAKILIKGNPVLAIPESAVVRFGDKEYIFIAQGKNTFRFTQIITGTIEGGYIELKEDPGRWANETIVTRNAYSLLMKMKNTSEE